MSVSNGVWRVCNCVWHYLNSVVCEDIVYMFVRVCVALMF